MWVGNCLFANGRQRGIRVYIFLFKISPKPSKICWWFCEMAWHAFAVEAIEPGFRRAYHPVDIQTPWKSRFGSCCKILIRNHAFPHNIDFRFKHTLSLKCTPCNVQVVKLPNFGFCGPCRHLDEYMNDAGIWLIYNISYESYEYK